MAITVKHKFVSAIPDGADATVVRPSNWNDDHDLTGTIPVANGGTGATTLTGYVYGNGTSAMTASTTVPSTAITGLGTMSTQNANAVAVTGGSVDGTTIGTTTASNAAFTYASTNSYTSTTPALSYNASNSCFVNGATVSGSYLQNIMQNKSATAGASTNFAVSNNLGTDSTYYGEFGMNSSVFSASTPADYFSINNGVYYSGHDGDLSYGSGNGYKTYLAWGTTGQSAHVINVTGAIGLNTNLGTTPALSGTTNFGTSGQVLTSGGSAATPTWTTPATGTVTSVSGTTGRITSTGGATPVIDLSSGVATAGTTGSSSLIPVVTIDTYGRVTSITTAANPQGTVTSVTATSPVTSTGGATPVIAMPAATTSVNGYLTSTDWNTFNGKGSGTVTSVAALTLGTTGTDLSSTVATGTTTPVITLQVPTASASNRGALSSTDWSTFNGKQAALVSGTNIKTVSGTTLLGSGDLGVIGATYGGTGQSVYAVGDIVYASTTTALSKLADVATGNALISGGVGVAPSYGKIGLTTHVSGTLPVANGGTNSTATPTAGGAIYGTGTAYAITAAGTTGQVLTSNGASAPTWTTPASGGSAATPTALGTVYGATDSAGATILGYQAGFSNTSSKNIFLGYQAGYLNTAGSSNIAIGYQALRFNVTSGQHVAIGESALFFHTGPGDSCVAIGQGALYNSITCQDSIAIGQSACSSSTSGYSNICIGRTAGNSITSGSQNTILGVYTGNAITTGTNNIVIGYNAQASAATVSNEITIGNSSNKVVRYPHSYSTVASLPSATTVGRGSRTFVTDALAPVFQATVAGSGAVFTPVYSDGTNWKVG